MTEARCTNCGANLEVEQGKKTAKCDYCQSTIIVSNALALAEVKIDHTKDLLKHRENLKVFVKKNSIDEILRVSQHIKDLIPKDFSANYYFAYAKQEGNQPKFMYEFLDNPFEGTEEEVEDVTKHIFKRSDLRDKPKVIGFLNQVNADLVHEYNLVHSEREQLEDYYSNIPRDVFICHSSYDNAIAQKVVQELEYDYNTCWISTRNLRPDDTENYWNNIKSAIKSCSIFMVITSENSQRSKDVQKEVEIANELNKPRFEYVIDNKKRSLLFKHVFDGIKWVDGTTSSGNYGKLAEKVYELKVELKEQGVPFLTKIIKPKKRKSVLSSKFGLVSLWVILLGIVGYFGYSILGNQSDTSSNTLVQTDSTTPSINDTSSETYDFQAHLDDNLFITAYVNGDTNIVEPFTNKYITHYKWIGNALPPEYYATCDAVYFVFDNALRSDVPSDNFSHIDGTSNLELNEVKSFINADQKRIVILNPGSDADIAAMVASAPEDLLSNDYDYIWSENLSSSDITTTENTDVVESLPISEVSSLLLLNNIDEKDPNFYALANFYYVVTSSVDSSINLISHDALVVNDYYNAEGIIFGEICDTLCDSSSFGGHIFVHLSSNLTALEEEYMTKYLPFVAIPNNDYFSVTEEGGRYIIVVRGEAVLTQTLLNEAISRYASEPAPTDNSTSNITITDIQNAIKSYFNSAILIGNKDPDEYMSALGDSSNVVTSFGLRTNLEGWVSFPANTTTIFLDDSSNEYGYLLDTNKSIVTERIAEIDTFTSDGIYLLDHGTYHYLYLKGTTTSIYVLMDAIMNGESIPNTTIQKIVY